MRPNTIRVQLLCLCLHSNSLIRDISFNGLYLLFIEYIYYVSGTLIYRLRAVDPDDDTLTFGIKDQIGSDILRLEAISSNEANIYLVKELDREV